MTWAINPSNHNRLIQYLCTQDRLQRALQLLLQEPRPTLQTYEFLLRACAQNECLSDARFVHQHLIGTGYGQDSYLATKLISVYAHLNSLEDARWVFEKTPGKTIHMWNALIRAFALSGKGEDGIRAYREMYQSMIDADSFTYTYALKVCCLASYSPSWLLGLTKKIHGHIFRHVFQFHIHVATSLIDTYAEFGSVLYANRVFQLMTERNVVSWSALIAGYSKNCRPFDALWLFWQMNVKDRHILPNSVTMVNVLQACGALASLLQGKLMHAYVLRRGLSSTLSVMNALVSMYFKCGTVELGRRVFQHMNRRDVISWNSVISGYEIHGLGREAIKVFQQMIEKEILPNQVTFLSVIGACSHMGLVEEGKGFFELMVRKYKIVPSVKHYACMVDLLGRAGQFDEVLEVIGVMQMEPGPTVWGSLLGACRIHQHVGLAQQASRCLFELEPSNAGNYVLLADTYAGAKMWGCVDSVKGLFKGQRLERVPGCSWIEVKTKIYAFVSTDKLNPQTEYLHALLINLLAEMKDRGYIPIPTTVSCELFEHVKEEVVLGHSEKLAIVFGLVNTCDDMTIRVTKNLRLCNDCHSFMKLVSKMKNREIHIRDVNRFHHFKDGNCSCAEYC